MNVFSNRNRLAMGALAVALLASPAALARGGNGAREARNCRTDYAPVAVPELDGTQAGMAGALLVGAFLLLTSRRREEAKAGAL